MSVSRRPSRLTASATAARTCSSFVTSQVTTPAAGTRSMPSASAPRCRSTRSVAEPNAPAPPVTIAARPVNAEHAARLRRVSRGMALTFRPRSTAERRPAAAHRRPAAADRTPAAMNIVTIQVVTFSGMGEYRIDELARLAATTVRNVRVYQDRGLLAPPRRDGRVGIYTDAHLARLRLIGRLLRRGYTFAIIGEMLAVWERGGDLAEILDLESAI